MDPRSYAKMEREENKTMDIRMFFAIAGIYNADIHWLIANPAVRKQMKSAPIPLLFTLELQAIFKAQSVHMADVQLLK